MNSWFWFVFISSPPPSLSFLLSSPTVFYFPLVHLAAVFTLSWSCCCSWHFLRIFISASVVRGQQVCTSVGRSMVEMSFIDRRRGFRTKRPWGPSTTYFPFSHSSFWFKKKKCCPLLPSIVPIVMKIIEGKTEVSLCIMFGDISHHPIHSSKPARTHGTLLS